MRTALRSAMAAALAALLLQSGVPRAAAAAENKHLTAILLVARAQLPDPNFADSVVLVMNNLGPAPVGIIINRPTSVPVAQLFPDLKGLARLHDKIYFGGPVEMTSVWFLFRASNAPPRHAIRTFEGVYLSADRDLLLELLRREKPMEGLRIFIGHAGWAPGQLEGEIAQKDWRLEHAAPAAIFGGTPDAPWPAPSSPAMPQS